MITAQSVLDWLEARAEGVPESLVESMREAVSLHAQYESVAAGLRQVAEELLEMVGRDEDDPHVLLAADALVTYACEALAEQDPGALKQIS